jgi:hypothetical protein
MVPYLSSSMTEKLRGKGSMRNNVPPMRNSKEVPFREKVHDMVSPMPIPSSWAPEIVDYHLIFDR